MFARLIVILGTCVATATENLRSAAVLADGSMELEQGWRRHFRMRTPGLTCEQIGANAAAQYHPPGADLARATAACQVCTAAHNNIAVADLNACEECRTEVTCPADTCPGFTDDATDADLCHPTTGTGQCEGCNPECYKYLYLPGEEMLCPELAPQSARIVENRRPKLLGHKQEESNRPTKRIDSSSNKKNQSTPKKAMSAEDIATLMNAEKQWIEEANGAKFKNGKIQALQTAKTCSDHCRRGEITPTDTQIGRCESDCRGCRDACELGHHECMDLCAQDPTV